jgi:hypothetical protein
MGASTAVVTEVIIQEQTLSRGEEEAVAAVTSAPNKARSHLVWSWLELEEVSAFLLCVMTLFIVQLVNRFIF